MQTIYDTCVFALIMYKAVMSVVRNSKGGRNIQTTIAKHGVLYYA